MPLLVAPLMPSLSHQKPQEIVAEHTSKPSSTSVLGGSWDLVSKVISTLIGVIGNYKYSYLPYNPSY